MEQNNMLLLEDWEKASQRTVDGKGRWKIMSVGKIRTKFRNHD